MFAIFLLHRRIFLQNRCNRNYFCARTGFFLYAIIGRQFIEQKEYNSTLYFLVAFYRK